MPWHHSGFSPSSTRSKRRLRGPCPAVRRSIRTVTYHHKTHYFHPETPRWDAIGPARRQVRKKGRPVAWHHPVFGSSDWSYGQSTSPLRMVVVYSFRDYISLGKSRKEPRSALVCPPAVRFRCPRLLVARRFLIRIPPAVVIHTSLSLEENSRAGRDSNPRPSG